MRLTERKDRESGWTLLEQTPTGDAEREALGEGHERPMERDQLLGRRDVMQTRVEGVGDWQ